MRKLFLLILFITAIANKKSVAQSYVMLEEIIITGSYPSGMSYWDVQNMINDINYYYSNNTGPNGSTGYGCDNNGGTVDMCGVCRAVGETPCTPDPQPTDCAGVANGDAVWTQECGCIGGTTGREACPPACSGPSNVSITWNAQSFPILNENSASTTTPTPFNVQYKACADIPNGVWRLRVTSITGGVTTVIRIASWERNPITNPPITQTQAEEAVIDMKAYYSRGTKGDWHTSDATISHEKHHYLEWKCASEYYWPIYLACLDQFTVPLNSYFDEVSALSALLSKGAYARINSFFQDASAYFSLLPDNASSRPFAAGQATLNIAITSVQNLAATKGWTVTQGVNNPSYADPCFLSKPASSNTSNCQ